MGMDAVLYAVGHFHQDLAQYLEYDPMFYADTIEGAPVITTVVSCHTTSMSKGLAKALDIDPWDFNDHVNIPMTDHVMCSLDMFFNEFEGAAANDKFLQVQELKEAGFIFIYMPNG